MKKTAGVIKASPAGRGDWQTRIEARSIMTDDAETSHVESLLKAIENDERVFMLLGFAHTFWMVRCLKAS